MVWLVGVGPYIKLMKCVHMYFALSLEQGLIVKYMLKVGK